MCKALWCLLGTKNASEWKEEWIVPRKKDQFFQIVCIMLPELHLIDRFPRIEVSKAIK